MRWPIAVSRAKGVNKTAKNTITEVVRRFSMVSPKSHQPSPTWARSAGRRV